MLGKIIEDFKIVEKISSPKNSKWKCICLKCGEEKIISRPNLNHQKGTKCSLLIKPNDRFYSSILKERLLTNRKITSSGCWEWTRALYKDGYGITNIRRDVARVHRLSYLLFIGDIPENLCVLHRCDNKKCFNPEHLFLGTYKDNAQDMTRKGRHGTKKY